MTKNEKPQTTSEETKPFWASQTIWSSVAVVGASAAGAWLAWRSSDFAAFCAAITAALGGPPPESLLRPCEPPAALPAGALDGAQVARLWGRGPGVARRLRPPPWGAGGFRNLHFIDRVR